MLTSMRRHFGQRTASENHGRARPCPARKALPPRRLELESLEQRLVLSPIWDKYLSLGGPNGFLGQPTTPEYVAPDNVGHYEHFQGGSIYWSPATAAHEVHGAIRDEWSHLGWERSFLGYPVTDETTSVKGDGRYNFFQGGLVMWSPATGAHEIHGAILGEYAGLSYERSALGYPTSDERGTADGVGRFNNFQNGAIDWTPRTGAHEVHGAIYGEWGKTGFERGILGYPVTDETTSGKGDGRYNFFQGGLVMWSPSSGAHEIHGAILQEYASIGYERSVVGYPTSDETDTFRHDGRFNNFQYGNIYWSPATGAHEVHGAIWGEYSHLGWELSFLGFPTTDETTTVKGDGRYNFFQGGLVMWSPATGAHEIHGAILTEYASLGYERSPVGYPTSDETDTARHDGRFNNFQYGNIYWSPATGAHEVHGAIWGEYTQLGWELSFLGFPTSDETATDKAGRYNSFQGGYILWSAGTGAHEIHGAILTEYASLGWQDGPLGFPTSDETDTYRHDGRFNNFQFGNIYWSPATGAHEVHGAIWGEYTHLGWELGFLGFPTSDETDTYRHDGRFNTFQGGTIFWSPATGAHEVHGAILQEYAGMGWETGALGFPVTDETGTPDGFGRFNHFQGGTIYWTPWMGTSDLFLRDRSLIAVEQSAAWNGVLDRNGLLAVFGQIENEGSVSPADLADLQALESVPDIAMPDYVRNLANKVINGNPANAQYQGQFLGNLFAGSSALQLTQLVSKWFVGADHPAAVDGNGNPYSYQLASGTLFGAAINGALDVVQGAVGDCYYIASLGEVAYRNPDGIRQMFIDNGDGTYTERFFNNGVADYVTVDRYFPADGNGYFVYNNHNDQLSDRSNTLWVALAEKAYAQLAEEGWTRGAGAANSYASISGGDPQNTLKEITGLATAGHNLASTSDRDAMSDAFNNGKFVVLATPSSGVAANVVPNHAYFLTYASPDSDVFVLINPWGLGASQPGILILTWNEVAASFNYWAGTN